MADIRGIFDDNIQGLIQEIQTIEKGLARWGGDKSYLVRRADLESAEGGRTTYELELDGSPRPPEYTSVVIRKDEKVITGFTEERPKNREPVMVSLESRPKFALSGATVSFDPTEILKRTQAALVAERDAPRPSPLLPIALGAQKVPVKAGTIPKEIDVSTSTPSQRAAIEKAMGSRFLMTYGPPGTGKTRTLGHVAAAFYFQETQRTYILAPTNTAVDQALLQTAEAIGDPEVGTIARLGRTLNRDLRDRGFTLDAITEHRGAAVYDAAQEEIARFETSADEHMKKYNHLFRSKRKRQKGASLRERLIRAIEILRTVALKERNKGIFAELQEMERLHQYITDEIGHPLMSARIVGMTLARAALGWEELPKFDNALIDESSMVGIPSALVGARLATHRFHMFGDPMQTQPIVMARGAVAKRTLGRNLYRYHGIERPDPDNPKTPLLRTQFRMDPPIVAVANDLVYDNTLETHASVLERPPFPGHSLALVDTSEMGLLVERSGRSRKNPGSAALTAGLVQRLHTLGITNIGVVTPFRPQTKELHREIRELVPDFYRQGGKLGTIHSFQGGQKEVVLFDLCDTPPRLGRFLNPSGTPELLSLLNVAITRPERCLVIIGHATGFRKAHGFASPIVQAAYAAVKHGVHVRPTPETPNEDIVAEVLTGLTQPTLGEAAGVAL